MKVQVEGLRELRKALRQADLQDRLKDANQKVAREVAGWAETRKAGLAGRYPAYGNVQIKGSRVVKGAQVIVGPKSVGVAGEFGAHVHPVFGRPRPQSQFRRRVWPPYTRDGHLVYPTLDDRGDDIADLYGAEIDRLLDGIGD